MTLTKIAQEDILRSLVVPLLKVNSLVSQWRSSPLLHPTAIVAHPDATAMNDYRVPCV